MLFYLNMLNLAKVLDEDTPTVEKDETNKQKLIVFEAWKHIDFLCRNYVLNGLDDTLYNMYATKKIAKELWQFLNRKYKIEDAGSKKFVVGQFLDYKMVDSKTVIYQV